MQTKTMKRKTKMTNKTLENTQNIFKSDAIFKLLCNTQDEIKSIILDQLQKYIERDEEIGKVLKFLMDKIKLTEDDFKWISENAPKMFNYIVLVSSVILGALYIKNINKPKSKK